MITIFTIPKPFNGHIGLIQRNAIQSWLHLIPSCEVILFGNEDGTSSVASEFGVKYVPDIAKNEYGTPLLSDVFEKAQKMASNEIVCYVNADIILMNDFIKSINSINNKSKLYMVVGRRWNIDIDTPINFSKKWEENFRAYTYKNGKLYVPSGIDYFVFPRGLFKAIPSFAIGRPKWDNWMIYEARSNNVPVIDATYSIMAVHQNHDYSHLNNIENRFGNGPEAHHNLILAGGPEHLYTIYDSNLVIINNLLIPAFGNKFRKFLINVGKYKNNLINAIVHIGKVK